MSALKETLDRIHYWFQENHPTRIVSLTSGLSSSEINAVLSTLPFQVSKEVRELYEWSNGYPNDYPLDTWIFDRMSLLNLDSAVQQAQTWAEESCEEAAIRYMGKSLFPIFEAETDNLAIVATNNQQETSPIIRISQDGGMFLQPTYTSLTNMMLTLAESYETGGFFIGSNGYVEEDEKKYAAAYRKYNSRVVDLALERFQNTLPSNPSWEAVEALHGDLCTINRYEIEISSSNLKTRVVNVLLNLLQDEQNISGFSVVLALEELRAVDALIQALKHSDKWVRGRAAFTLGKIKAFEAIDFVSQLSEDPDPIVQEAVQEALELLRKEK